MHRWIKRSVAAVSLAGILLSGCIAWLGRTLPDTYHIEEGAGLQFAQFVWLQPLRQRGVQAAQQGLPDQSGNVTLSLLGLVPIKTVRTVAVERPTVLASGRPFGIKMFSDGALIVGFSDLRTGLGLENPAKEAGLHLGDLIVSVDGKTVRTNQQLADAVTAAAGRTVRVVYRRAGEQQTAWLTPVQESASDGWHAGMWVRDSSAGLGTLTFVEEQGVFGGLGHAISDSDTGENITLLSGEIVGVTITDCVKGTSGSPGELRGQFDSSDTLGQIAANCTEGVFGRLSTTAQQLSDGEYPVAFAQEVQTGPAQILTTIEGQQPALYDVVIEHLSLNEDDPNRNMVLHVTDPTLLAQTGGIVQGMSGSPILQNGYLVGAVTHVLINDPTRGYGIFAETMLEQAESVTANAEAA